MAKVTAAGYPKFSMHHHSQLWSSLDAKDGGNDGYGGLGDYKSSWVWYDKWFERVVEYCAREGERLALGILSRQREPTAPLTIMTTPQNLRLRQEPLVDCARYDSLRRAI